MKNLLTTLRKQKVAPKSVNIQINLTFYLVDGYLTTERPNREDRE